MAEIKHFYANTEDQLNKKTLSVKEAAEYIGISTDTIYTMARQKQVPHIKCRGRILFRQTSLDQWMDEQEKMNWVSSHER